MRVWRWPRSFSASSERPLMRAASPTTTATRSVPPRSSRASARPSAMERPVPAWPPSKTSCGTLGAPWEAADAAQLAERPELFQAAGQQLMGVRLVARVPHDVIVRAVHQPMEGHGDLDDAERTAQVAARASHRLDDRGAQLGAQLGQFGVRQLAQVGRPLERGEDGHVRRIVEAAGLRARRRLRRGQARPGRAIDQGKTAPPGCSADGVAAGRAVGVARGAAAGTVTVVAACGMGWIVMKRPSHTMCTRA